MPDLSEDENRFIELLTGEEYQGQGNNGLLRRELAWNDEKYWHVRNNLIEKGLVTKALGGPGGKTVIVPAEEKKDSQSEPGKEPADDSRLNEDDLYEPMYKQINKNLIPAGRNYDTWHPTICARLGRRKTGGKWSRPDIAGIGVHKFKFISAPVIDVLSFEIKPADAVSVEAVFEALSHRQRSNLSYVIYHASKDSFEKENESDRIISLAAQHGVGVYVAENPKDYFSWVELVSAQRWEPDPADINDFIQQCFPDEEHDEILKIIK